MYLGGKVLGGATEGLEAVRGEVLGQSKVGELDVDVRPAVDHEDVFGFELETRDNDGRNAVRNNTQLMQITLAVPARDLPSSIKEQTWHQDEKEDTTSSIGGRS